MSNFTHSAVLFSGDDGLPLEFNVRNANEKVLLKALIEHGGGICSQSESAVHLISPGTKVLRADLGKMLVSSQYIIDCVKENNLLEVDEFVLTVKETQISDISDDDSEDILPNPVKSSVKEKPPTNALLIKAKENSNSDVFKTSQSTVCASADQFTSSSKSDSFVEGSVDAASHVNLKRSIIQSLVSKSPRIKFTEICPSDSTEVSENFCPSQQFASTAKDDCLTAGNNFAMMENNLSPIKDSLSLISPEKYQNKLFESFPSQNVLQSVGLFPINQQAESSVLNTIVSSSQPEKSKLDQFDNLLLEKAQNKQDEDLSQSYTVSSSADALASLKPNSEDVNSVELFDKEPPLPDSPGESESININPDEYMKRLEEEVEQILLKPPPKSIQDKIILVKYVCCVKKLTPAIVLQSLQHL